MRNKKYRDRDWLYTEYWVNERSAPNMARECGVTKRVIHYWMEKHNIPLRTLSEAKRGSLSPFYGKKHTAEAKRKCMEHELDRYLEPKEVVHHKDGDVSNNNPENLQLFATNGKHCSFHCDEKRYARYVTSV